MVKPVVALAAMTIIIIIVMFPRVALSGQGSDEIKSELILAA